MINTLKLLIVIYHHVSGQSMPKYCMIHSIMESNSNVQDRHQMLKEKPIGVISPFSEKERYRKNAPVVIDPNRQGAIKDHGNTSLNICPANNLEKMQGIRCFIFDHRRIDTSIYIICKGLVYH